MWHICYLWLQIWMYCLNTVETKSFGRYCAASWVTAGRVQRRSSVSDVLMDLPPADNYRLSYTNVTLKVITIVICLCGWVSIIMEGPSVPQFMSQCCGIRMRTSQNQCFKCVMYFLTYNLIEANKLIIITWCICLLYIILDKKKIKAILLNWWNSNAHFNKVVRTSFVFLSHSYCS